MCTYAVLLLVSTATLVVGTKMDAATIQDLMTPMLDLAEGCGYHGCPTSVDGVLNVHIVPHTHGELGRTRTFQQYYTGKFDSDPTPTNINMKRILDFVMTELWDHENRKFTLYDTPYLFHWWANRDDTVYRMVYQLLRQGRLHVVGGGWGMPDEACTSYHALIDHFTLALRKLNRMLGPCARPLVSWQVDVFGHSREFAALTAMLGFDGLFVNPISFEDELSRMQAKELEMVWRGSDDLGESSDIFTHKLFDGYWAPPGFCFATDCNDTLLIHTDSLFRNFHERVTEFVNSVKHRQGGSYATNHVMVMMGKRMAYYDANMWFKNIDVLIQKVNEKSVRDGDKVHLMYSAPACYLKAVHESGVALPIKQDDFMSMSYDKLTHFTGQYTSRPTIKYMAREGHVYLQMAKQLHVLANLTAKKTKLYEDLAWITGVFQDHGIITGAMIQEVSNYYTHRMYRAVQKSTVILQTAFNKLRRSAMDVRYFRCAFNVSSCRNTNSLRSFVVIYNPLAWPVTVPIRLPVVRHSRFMVYNHKLELIRSVMMKISTAVLRIPYRDTRADHEIVFLAGKLPPMGFRSYYIESVTVAARKKRSIIKKLRKNKKKKYLARQTDQMKIDDKSMLDTLEHEHYDYGDEEEDSDEMYDEAHTTVSPNSTASPSDITALPSDTTDQPIDTTNLSIDTVSQPFDTTDSYATTISRFDSTNILYDKFNMTSSTTSASGFIADDEEDMPLLRIHPTRVPHKWVPGYRDSFVETTTNTPNKTVSVDDEAENIETRKFFDTSPLKSQMSSTTPPPITTRTTEHYYDAFNDPDLDEDKHYFYRASTDKFIRNKYIKVHLDDNNQATRITLSNGVQLALKIEFYYYVSDDPMKLERAGEKRPGPNVFRPMDPTPVKIQEHLQTVVLKTYIVEEVQYSLASWLGFVVRVYAEQPVVEMDWVVGPVPIDDDLGKEIFVRYSTDLVNDGVFYTDSNGRQTIKRIRNRRPSYDPVQTNIPSNIYPVTSKIYIEDTDRNIRFSVFNDRSQGGTSLHDGQIDLMLHRRILTDENYSDTWLNETEYGRGIMVRGKHYLYVSKADYKPNKIFEKKFAKEVELSPQIFACPFGIYGNRMKDVWYGQRNEFRGVVKKIPIGVHVLTFQEWNDNTLLLRLENYLEKSDVFQGGVRTVYVKDLFANITINGLRETTLGGNVWLEDHVPMRWNLKDKFVKNFNDFYGGNGTVEYDANDPIDLEKADVKQGIKLLPQQIRTFVVTYERIGT